MNKLSKKKTQNLNVIVATYEGNGHEYDLALNRIGAIVQDKGNILALIKQSQTPIKIVGEALSQTSNAMPFLKNETGQQLQLKVNEALKSMREDGTLAKLSEQWFGGDITI